jgi:transposase-like protein
MPRDDPRIDSREVAKRLDVHPITVKRWRAKGQGPAYENPAEAPRVVRYRLSEVERFRRERGGDCGAP